MCIRDSVCTVPLSLAAQRCQRRCLHSAVAAVFRAPRCCWLNSAASIAVCTAPLSLAAQRCQHR
eukprot:3511508-Pleurochrysis_carterae.AAC.1